jgi:hypothetical protein
VLLISSGDFERREINGDSQWAYLSVYSVHSESLTTLQIEKDNNF